MRKRAGAKEINLEEGIDENERKLKLMVELKLAGYM